METIAYTIIAAIVFAMGWTVWAVIKEDEKWTQLH